MTVDVTAIFRPTLKHCPSKHYHPEAKRALPAVIFGVIGEVGEIGGQRVACPLAFERVHPKDPSEQRLWQSLLTWVHRRLAPDEVAVMDAGVKLSMSTQHRSSVTCSDWPPTSPLAATSRCMMLAKAASLFMVKRFAHSSALTRARRSQPPHRIE